MKADILEKMLPRMTQVSHRSANFHISIQGKEVVQGQAERGMDVRAALTQSLSSPGHPGCQQTSRMICNRTPLPTPTDPHTLPFMFVSRVLGLWRL